MFALLTVVLTGAIASLACRDGADEKVSLALDWVPNSNHAGIYEALKRGYFTDEGFDVNVYTPSDPSSILQTVGAGRDDFGISYQPDLLQARSEGVPVVSIAALVQHPLNSVMALKSSGIERPAHLEGKKVGYPGIASNKGMLENMLASDGLTLEDVALIDVGFDLVPALLSGTVDAILGGYWTHESILIEQEGQPVNVLRMESWGVPDFYELLLVTNEKTIADRPETVRKFVRAFVKGYEAAIDNPSADVVATLFEANPEAVQKEVELKGIDLLKPVWADATTPFGSQTQARWNSFGDWMKSQGLIGADLRIADAWNGNFMPAK